MKITVHDGFDTIGGNKIEVCSSSGECFLLDFGLNFSRWGHYFEEFVKPRTGRIIEDLLKLDLIPKIPVYRSDLTERFQHDGRYAFVFLSHAHADHCGMVGLLSEEIPVVATVETLAMMEVDSGVGNSDVWSSFPGKERAESSNPLVRKDLKESKGKKYILKRRVFGIKLEGFETVENVWEDLRTFRVYHSILGASAIAVKVDGWWVVYTGDFRFGPRGIEERYWLETFKERRVVLAKRTEEFVKSVKELHPMILIVEGTRVTRSENIETTEKDVHDNALKIISKHDGLVLVDFPVRHIERLLTFLRIAIETGRKLLLTPKEYVYIEKLQEMEPSWSLDDDERKHLGVYHVGKLTYQSLEKDYMKRAMDSGIVIEPEDVSSSPNSFMIYLGYWTIPNLLDFDEKVLENTVYIHSTSEAYSEEQEIDARRLFNWFKRFGVKPFGIDLKGEELVYTKEFHASGHASPSDIEAMIDELDPELVIPVHTLDRGWFVERWGERIVVSNVFERG